MQRNHNYYFYLKTSDYWLDRTLWDLKQQGALKIKFGRPRLFSRANLFVLCEIKTDGPIDQYQYQYFI